jgi:hypothetical protein
LSYRVVTVRVALLSVLVVLASAGAAAALTLPDYRTRATSICKQTSAKLAKVKSPQSAEDLGRFLKGTLPVFRAHRTALQRLSPPKSLSALHLRVLRLEKQQIDGIQALVKRIDRGADPAKAFDAANTKLSKVGDAESAAFLKLDLPACANL